MEQIQKRYIPASRKEMKNWISLEDNAEGIAKGVAATLVSGITIGLGRMVQKILSERADRKLLVRELSSQDPTVDDKTVREILQETSTQVNVNTVLREEQGERIKEMNGQIASLRTDMRLEINALRKEASDREDRQERRIGDFLGEVRNLFHSQHKKENSNG